MSDNKIDKNITDEEIEKLFKQSSSKSEGAQLKSDQESRITKKIIRKARTETSAKTITEYSLVNFWTGILEFIKVFCTLLDPKTVKEKDNKKNNKELK